MWNYSPQLSTTVISKSPRCWCTPSRACVAWKMWPTWNSTHNSVIFNNASPDSTTICYCHGEDILTRNLILNFMSTIAVRVTAFKTSLQYTHDRSRHLQCFWRNLISPRVDSLISLTRCQWSCHCSVQMYSSKLALYTCIAATSRSTLPTPRVL